MGKIYILLPVHNRRKITQCFIDCLKVQTLQNYHLILVDDGSTDGTAQMVKEEIESLTVISGNGNLWWAGGLQQGYLWLKSNIADENAKILIINDDTIFAEDFLAIGHQRLDLSSKTLILSQCYSQDTNQLIDVGVYADWKNFRFMPVFEPEKVNCFSTNGLFIKWKDFQSIGGFRPRLLPHYASDYEFTIRAHRKGMKLVTHPDLKLYSNESTTGYRIFERDSLQNSLKRYFSNKSAVNPITLSIFIALSCPWQWKLLNWLRVWRGAKHQIQEFWVQSNL